MPHICVSESNQHWFRQWLVAYSAPSHYLNQCWIVVNWSPRNKLQWNFNLNSKLFIHKNVSGNIVCEIAAILSRVRWVNLKNTTCIKISTTRQEILCSCLIQWSPISRVVSCLLQFGRPSSLLTRTSITEVYWINSPKLQGCCKIKAYRIVLHTMDHDGQNLQWVNERVIMT